LPDAAVISEVDRALNDWQQGDVILGADLPFFHLADVSRPISLEAEEFASVSPGGEPLANIAYAVEGLVVTTQTCDVVRSCMERALVQVAALVQVDGITLEETKRGFRPRYGFVPGVEALRLVADLNAIMTIDKAVLTQTSAGKRVRGCPADGDQRQFAEALSRNLSRFAFPDDFVTAVKPVQKRIVEKHGKATRDRKGNPTNEGDLLLKLSEIRVSCLPSWGATDNELAFYFIFESRADIPANAEAIVEGLMQKFKPVGIFREAQLRIVTLNEMSAAAYKSSAPLDLDNLTSGSTRAPALLT
jgi:hypothetical protein